MFPYVQTASIQPSAVLPPLTPTQLKRELLRIAYGQVRLAEKLGVTPTEVRHWLAGDDPVPHMVALDIRNLPSDASVRRRRER
jgi:hypothetical protein